MPFTVATCLSSETRPKAFYNRSGEPRRAQEIREPRRGSSARDVTRPAHSRPVSTTQPLRWPADLHDPRSLAMQAHGLHAETVITDGVCVRHVRELHPGRLEPPYRGSGRAGIERF